MYLVSYYVDCYEREIELMCVVNYLVIAAICRVQDTSHRTVAYRDHSCRRRAHPRLHISLRGRLWLRYIT